MFVNKALAILTQEFVPIKPIEKGWVMGWLYCGWNPNYLLPDTYCVFSVSIPNRDDNSGPCLPVYVIGKVFNHFHCLLLHGPECRINNKGNRGERQLTIFIYWMGAPFWSTEFFYPPFSSIPFCLLDLF